MLKQYRVPIGMFWISLINQQLNSVEENNSLVARDQKVEFEYVKTFIAVS